MKALSRWWHRKPLWTKFLIVWVSMLFLPTLACLILLTNSNNL